MRRAVGLPTPEGIEVWQMLRPFRVTWGYSLRYVRLVPAGGSQ